MPDTSLRTLQPCTSWRRAAECWASLGCFGTALIVSLALGCGESSSAAEDGSAQAGNGDSSSGTGGAGTAADGGPSADAEPIVTGPPAKTDLKSMSVSVEFNKPVSSATAGTVSADGTSVALEVDLSQVDEQGQSKLAQPLTVHDAKGNARAYELQVQIR